MSDKIVCPATRKKGPVVPLNTHNAVKVARLLLNAHPSEQRVKMIVATIYDDRLPMIVVIGSHIRAEVAIPTNTPALAVLILIACTPKVAAISGFTVMMEVPMKVTGRAIQQTANSVTHRRSPDIVAATSSEYGIGAMAGGSSGSLCSDPGVLGAITPAVVLTAGTSMLKG